MEGRDFYHLFANGSDAKNFIVSEGDYRYQFNLVGISAIASEATVVAFSLEDTHLHALLFGTKNQCNRFKTCYETSTIHHISSTRGDKDNVNLACSLYLVDNESYLMNVASYVIIQPTKDGKRVMPYDYKWGTGSLYFRADSHSPIWLARDDGAITEVTKFKDLSVREKRALTRKYISIVPEEWEIADGLILPTNYVDIKLFESIFKTPNRFRVFSSSGKGAIDSVLDRMASVRTVMLEDLEARKLCKDICSLLFHKESARHLTVNQRISLGRELNRKYRMSVRQAATLSRLPEEELAKYL